MKPAPYLRLSLPHASLTVALMRPNPARRWWCPWRPREVVDPAAVSAYAQYLYTPGGPLADIVWKEIE